MKKVKSNLICGLEVVDNYFLIDSLNTVKMKKCMVLVLPAPIEDGMEVSVIFILVNGYLVL
ncbi:DNA ligase [Leptotrichia wadei]|uniref:DNA ligase n=1 Tax=Leptotrichia wadei TaxID=157687 RepID=A0A510KAJ1_9FUSO|nr:DNA ligase [Leptotrichia wadei]